MNAVSAPYFEDLQVGEVIDAAPGLTLTDGHAALHQAILGDRLRLPLDQELSRRVVGGEARVAHPGLVWDVAIGQSTLVTQRVVANLFYRGLVLHRTPMLGDTLRTTVEVAGLRQNRPRPDRAATGLAVLRVTTVDQEDRRVLDFWRCAMLPLRDPRLATGHDDALERIGVEAESLPLAAAVAGWRFAEYRSQVPEPRFADLEVGQRWEVAGGDVVSGAPELARLSLNIAIAHLDSAVSPDGRRLVYGGHTIGLVGSQIARAIPSLLTIVAWHSCDHLAPVHEGDTLRTTVELERAEPIADGAGLLHLHARTRAESGDGVADVLDWRLVGVIA